MNNMDTFELSRKQHAFIAEMLFSKIPLDMETRIVLKRIMANKYYTKYEQSILNLLRAYMISKL